MDNQDIYNALQREGDRGRRHTGDLSWHDRSQDGKAQVELGWLRALIDQLRTDGHEPYRNPIAVQDEWPDCEAATAGTGERVAVEVSEVVRGTSLAPGGAPTPWSKEELLRAVQDRILEKDTRGFHGGKYAEYVVLLHSDELYLTEEWVRPVLEGARFECPHGTIDTAFLVLGYRNDRRAYFRLSLTP